MKVVLRLIAILLISALAASLHAQEPAAPDTRQPLRAQLGWAEPALDDPAQLATALARRDALAASIDAARVADREDLLRLDGARAALTAQLAALPPRAPKSQRVAAALTLSTLATRAAALTARIDDARAAAALVVEERGLIAAHLRVVTEAARLREAQLVASRAAEQEALLKKEALKKEEQARKLREAESERVVAQAELDSIRERERSTRDAQLKQLLNEQGAVAERSLARAAERISLTQSLQAQREQESEAFVAARDAINVSLDTIPQSAEAASRVAAAEIDPLFARVRAARKKTRDQMLDAQDALAAARTQHDAAVDAHDAAQRRFTQLDLTQDERGGTELGRVGLQLASARARLAHTDLEIAALHLQDAEERVRLLADALSFYNTTLERLLPSISPEASSAFYSPLRDENWYETRRSFQFALMRTARWASQRASQLLSLSEQLSSVAFWGWVSGFVLRACAAVFLVYLARAQGRRIVRASMDSLMRRRALRMRPTLAIRLSAALRALMLPALFYASSLWLLGYLAPLLWETTYLAWLVHIFYSYQLLVTLVSALAMPRVVREDRLDGRGLDADAMLDDPQQADEADVQRSRKLVRSVKVVLALWLLNSYVSDGLVAWMGHSVVWRLVDAALFWGFTLVLYSVLSTWRDEIAAGFERIAAPRIPRAAAFVSENKDRPWGVLVIGLASIYVITYELANLIRRVVSDSDLWVSLNNFIFRKTIEYQRRGVEDEEDDETGSARVARLPEPYRAAFSVTPRPGEPWQRRDAELDAIERERSRWALRGYQGSIVLTGEPGQGKTTLLAHAGEALRAHPTLEGRAHRHSAIDHKLTDEPSVLAWLAALFELPEPPADREALIAALQSAPPALVTIDDLHHLFLRIIGGFDPMDAFLEVVHRTDSRHLWVMTCSHFAWSYLQRVRPRAHYIGATIRLKPLGEAAIKQIIDARNEATGMRIDFEDLVVKREDGEDYSYEVVRTSQGYFRLLHEFSQGNPAVAMTYWLRSLRTCEEPDRLRVVLFKQPTQAIAPQLRDDYWFALTALVQHGGLSVEQVAEVTNTDVGFANMALSYFEELRIVRHEAARYIIEPLMLRQILRYLLDSNFLYE